MSSIFKKSFVVVALVAALNTAAHAITIDLKPALEIPDTYNGQQVVAVGDSGMFLDYNASAPAGWQGANPNMQVAFGNYANPAKNFTWQSVTLEINDQTGNATVTGTMKNNALANDLYTFTMNLTGMCIKNGATCTAKSALPGVDLRTFLTNPANAQNSVLGTDLTKGFQWSNISVSISAVAGGPNPAYTGPSNLVGWTMGPHVNPVELYIWSNSPGPGTLYFTSWYQALNSAGKRIVVGDTKSFGTLLPGGTSIPEPSSVLLLGSGAVALLRKRRKN